MHDLIRSLAPLAVNGTAFSEQQAASLLPLLAGHLPDILALARLSASAGQSAPYLCAIVNAKSGRCPEDCTFCAQSAHHPTDSPVYPLLPRQELLHRAEAFAARGVRYMGIVISGTAPTPGDFARLCEDAVFIRARVDIGLCASFGILDDNQARSLKQAGFASCHHNLETAPSHYTKICTSHGIERRAATVRLARRAGLRVCSGGIFGLGESWTQRLEMAALLAELEVSAIPVNFLTPIAGTPLEGAPLVPPGEALAIIALLRLMHPDKDLVLCGGRSKILGEWERLAFAAGANAMITGDYLTTHGSPIDKDLAMLAELGITIR